MATRVFHDNFEDGTTDKWSFPGGNTHGTVITGNGDDGTPPHGGSKQLELYWNGDVTYPSSDTYSYVYLTGWDYTDEMLIRLWFRYDANVARTTGNKMIRLGKYSANFSFFCDASMNISDAPDHPLYAAVESMGGTGGPNSYGAGTQAGDGDWHKLEIYILHNTTGNSDGVFKVWCDGVSVINGTGLDMNAETTTNPWHELTFVSNWSDNPGWEHPGINNCYFDDVEIFSDATSGDACTGTMSDASITAGGSSLSGPTNLRWRPR